jgi:histidine triad (HIT) family protein
MTCHDSRCLSPNTTAVATILLPPIAGSERSGREDVTMALTDWYCEEVLAGILPVDRVFEDDRVLAFHHPQPSARPHVVVIPKAHVPSLLAPDALDGDLLVSMITAVQHAAVATGVDGGNGFYVRANAAGPGVTPHMHWHVLPGSGTNWPRLDDDGAS